MASGTFWNALERFSVMGIQLICTFVLARFLTPGMFGLMGMLVVFTLIAGTLTESGFSQALIREPDVDRRTLSTVFWANVLLSVVIYGLLWLSAPLIARFYHEPLLTDVSRMTFLVIPLGALSLIHQTLSTRQLAFRRMCLVSLTASLVSCALAVVWAWRTHSVWALVVQNVAAYALRTLGFWLTTHFRPSLTFAWSELKRLFSFAQNLLITGLIGNLFNNIYTLLIGRFYGTAQAGYFVQADRIRLVTSNSMTQVVQSVSYPILARINNEQAADCDIRSSYRSIILITLMAVGFMMTMLMNVGEDLMELLMGSAEWRTSGRYLLALGVVGVLYPLHAVNQNILLVKGLGRTVLWIEVARRSLMVLLIVCALQLNVEAFVWSYTLYSILLIPLNLYICGRPIGYGLRQQLTDIMPLLSGFLLMTITAQLSNHVLALQALPLRLTITLALTSLVGLFCFRKHPAFSDILSLVRVLLKRNR